MDDSRRGPLAADGPPAACGGDGGPDSGPDCGPRGETPAVAVLAATARASTAYTASAARSAATALVRMCVGLGMFGPGPWERPGEPDTVLGPAEAVDLHAPLAGPERMRDADGPARARRTAGPGAGCPAAAGVRPAGESAGRVARAPQGERPDGPAAAGPARAA
ncbi:hypothetical protein OG909_31975 [Streptomyces sp. NBC_01754]|uniref:hypothetical protein n=1 Tax=Streptomyces sp. NBC_01754 TaxID=2975930 RepID=UPI002DD79E72|nr:hypothetical protein [Streptomyces sp. NBC_01754]WSC90948.1 hypothetical protein OG909_00730 [Streptomyces sp. NBC_01754]WSC96558.1 hypothetical protein OG909_31975 [Streptomyces sp. NBC_01754]